MCLCEISQQHTICRCEISQTEFVFARFHNNTLCVVAKSSNCTQCVVVKFRKDIHPSSRRDMFYGMQSKFPLTEK